jgi:hypothetical protein
MENILVDNFIQVYFSLCGKIPRSAKKICRSELEKICNIAIVAHYCMILLIPKHDIYRLCMSAVKRGFLFLKFAGEAMTISSALVTKVVKTLFQSLSQQSTHSLSLTQSRTRRILKAEEYFLFQPAF